MVIGNEVRPGGKWCGLVARDSSCPRERGTVSPPVAGTSALPIWAAADPQESRP